MKKLELTKFRNIEDMALLVKASSFVKDGGAIYYQSIDGKEDCNVVIQTAFQCGMSLVAFAEDNAYDFRCHYYKFDKRK